MNRYRIAWRSRLTGATGHTDWTPDKGQATYTQLVLDAWDRLYPSFRVYTLETERSPMNVPEPKPCAQCGGPALGRFSLNFAEVCAACWLARPGAAVEASTEELAPLSGEALAQAVAVEVMGLTVARIYIDPYWADMNPPDGLFAAEPDVIEEIRQEKGMGGYRHFALVRYDRSIADAWPVVDRLKALGYDVELTVRAPQPEIPELLPYCVDVLDYYGKLKMLRDHEVQGEQLPQVICRAALAAVRARKETP